MASPTLGLWGAGAAATVYAAASHDLGWKVVSIGSRTADRANRLAADVGGSHSFNFDIGLPSPADLTIITTPPTDHASALDQLAAARDLVVTAPLASTLAEADRIVDVSASQRTIFGWPLVTAPTTQEMMRRSQSVGQPTSISMSSSRPRPTWGGYATGEWGGGALAFSGHDQIALTMLLARFVGLGRPATVSASMSLTGGVDVASDVTLTFSNGLAAMVSARWTDGGTPRSDIQLSGVEGVLRIDSNPSPSLEHDGEPVALPRRAVAHEQLRPLHVAGVIDMLKSIGALVPSRGPLPHAFTVEFGRDVLEVVAGAYSSAGMDSSDVALPFTGPRDRSPLDLLDPFH